MSEARWGRLLWLLKRNVWRIGGYVMLSYLPFALGGFAMLMGGDAVEFTNVGLFLAVVAIFLYATGLFAVLSHQVMYPERRIPPLLKGIKKFAFKNFFLALVVFFVLWLPLMFVLSTIVSAFGHNGGDTVLPGYLLTFLTTAATVFAWPSLFMLQLNPIEALVAGVRSLRTHFDEATACFALLAVSPTFMLVLDMAGASDDNPLQFIFPLMEVAFSVASFILSCLILKDVAPSVRQGG